MRSSVVCTRDGHVGVCVSLVTYLLVVVLVYR